MKIKNLLLIIITITFCLKCKKEAEFEFCFSTMVNGRVAVSATVGNTYVPCGYLSAFGGQETNEGYDFEKDTEICGASACCYTMEIPDSAFFEWGFRQEGHAARDDLVEHYKKRIKLPDFPKRKWNERYRVSFVIAYQDCVYCRIETVEK